MTSDQVQRQIASLANQGMTGPEICDELDLSRSFYAYHRLKAHNRGLIKARERRIGQVSATSVVYQFETEHGRSPGRSEPLWSAIGLDVATWIVSQCPEGVSALEYVAAIVRDAYNEEAEQCSTMKK